MASLILFGIALLTTGVAVPLVRRRVAPNALYGLRVPATYADETVWYDANAASGRDLPVLAGVLTAAGGVMFLALPFDSDPAVLIAVVLMVVGVLVVAAVGWRRANRMLATRRADHS